MTDYLAIWQLPIVLLLIAVWVGGGAYFLRRTLVAQVGRREADLNRCLLISTLAGIGAVLGAGIITLLAVTLASGLRIPVVFLALPAGLLAFALAGFLAIYVSFHLTARVAVGNWVKAFGLPLATMALIAIPTAAISYKVRHNDLADQQSLAYLQYLYTAIARQYLPTRPPGSLEQLVRENVVTPSYLIARKHPDRAVGFFYLACEIKPNIKDSRKLLACDWLDNLDGSSRVVLYNNGKVELLTADKCKAVLALEDNRAFAIALRQAEKKLLARK